MRKRSWMEEEEEKSEISWKPREDDFSEDSNTSVSEYAQQTNSDVTHYDELIAAFFFIMFSMFPATPAQPSNLQH